MNMLVYIAGKWFITITLGSGEYIYKYILCVLLLFVALLFIFYFLVVFTWRTRVNGPQFARALLLRAWGVLLCVLLRIRDVYLHIRCLCTTVCVFLGALAERWFNKLFCQQWVEREEYNTHFKPKPYIPIAQTKRLVLQNAAETGSFE